MAHAMLQPRGPAPLTADPVSLVRLVVRSTRWELCWECGKPLVAKGRVRRLGVGRHWCFNCESAYIEHLEEERRSMLRPDDDGEARWSVLRDVLDGERL